MTTEIIEQEIEETDETVFSCYTTDKPIIKRLTKLFKGAAKFLDEIYFVVTKEGISTMQLDNEKASMLELRIPSSVFLEYHYDTEIEEICVVVNSNNLKECVQKSKPNSLGFKIYKKHFDEIKGVKHFTIVTKNDMFTQEFGFYSQGGSCSEDKIGKPRYENDYDVSIKLDTLHTILKSAKVVGRYISLRVLDNLREIEFGVENDGTGDLMNTIIEAPDLTIINKSTVSKRTVYTLDILYDFTELWEKNDDITLKWAWKKPLMISSDKPESEGIYVSVIRAPRVERR